MSNEHNNAPAVLQGWTDADSDSARLALELECLLMDTKDLSVVSKWWASANEALELHRQRLAATPAPAPAQDVGLTDAWLLEQFKHHPNWELSTSNDPECDPNLFWLVHEVKGGRNDREWFLIGEGATPRHAIIAALRAKGGKL